MTRRGLSAGSRGAAFLAAVGVPCPMTKSPMISGRKVLSPATSDLTMLQDLPQSYTSLIEIFAGLCTVYEMTRKRNGRTTFQRLKASVEEASGRRFIIEHMGQLSALLPEEVYLEWVRLPVAPHSTKTELQLSITIKIKADDDQSIKTTPKTTLRRALVSHLRATYSVYLMRAVEAEARSGNSRRAQELEALAKDLPNPIENFLPGFVPELPASVMPAQPAPKAHFNFSAKKSVRVEVTTQITSSQQIEPLNDKECHWGTVIVSKRDFELFSSLPEELKRRSLDGSICLETLKRLDTHAEFMRQTSGPEALIKRREVASFEALPRTFAKMERVFSGSGPKVLKLSELVPRLQGELQSGAEVEDSIKALAVIAPEYISIKAFGSCGTPAVWLNRASDRRMVAKKVKSVASARHLRDSTPLIPRRMSVG